MTNTCISWKLKEKDPVDRNVSTNEIISPTPWGLQNKYRGLTTSPGNKALFTVYFGICLLPSLS